MDFRGWSPQSPRDRAGQRELCSLKLTLGMDTGWKNSSQAINYRRRESSPELGSFRNMVHNILLGKEGFPCDTHIPKKTLPGILVLDKTQGLSGKWLSQLAGGAGGADSPSASRPFSCSHCLQLG